jgi:hypothetical protein
VVAGALSLGACTYSFPSTSAEGTFACKVDSDCVAGYSCVRGFCSAGGGGDNGNNTGGDSMLPGQRSLNVTLAGAGTGTVVSTPARINCPGTCAGVFDENNTVTLTAAPTGGSFFGGFTGCTGTSGTTCSVVMNANKGVTVTFTTNTGGPAQTITNVVSGAGRVTGGGLTFDVQVGGGLAPTSTSGGGKILEAGSDLHPKQQR